VGDVGRELLPTQEEKTQRERAEKEWERKQKEMAQAQVIQERQKSEKLAAYLRSLGINPDEI